MKLLVSGVVLDQPMGGVRRHNQELLPRLAQRLEAEGGSLTVMAGANGVNLELPESIEVLPTQVPVRPIPMRMLRESQVLAELVKSRGFDAVHTGHLPVPRNLPVPFTWTVHDLRSLDGPGAAFSRRMFAKQVLLHALERARTVLTVSEATRSRLLELRADADVRLVPNGADHFTPLPRNPQGELLHLGHLEPRKNLEVVVRALALDPGLPPLRLAGAAKGGEGERLANLAKELGVDVRFHGPYEEAELPTLLAECAAVVMPSRYEGFGIPVLEAQRAGAPLAISNIPALIEVAGEDVDRFDPKDPEECAEAIRRALAKDAIERELPTWDAAADAWYAAVTP